MIILTYYRVPLTCTACHNVLCDEIVDILFPTEHITSLQLGASSIHVFSW